MKKFLILILLLIAFNLNIQAKCTNNSFRKIINESKIPEQSISISIKNINNGKTIYGLNEYRLMPPASVQKALTILPITEVLGNDYEFKTDLYLRGKKEYVIKLGADPYLTTSDLKDLVSKINNETIQQLYIDDSIIELKDWGEGWQWDDDLNPSIKRFNSYNLDENLIKYTIMPTETGKQAFIINPQKAPDAVYNDVITGDTNNVNISRDNSMPSGMLKLDGIVSTPESIVIPSNNLKRYFKKKLTDSLEDKRIYLKTAYKNTEKKDSDIKISTITHPISRAIDDVLLNSDNMVIETMSKLAGGKYYNKQGTDSDNVKLFTTYCIRNNIDPSGIRITDASGVSKNNLMNADFITEFLMKNKDNKIYDKLAKPGEGTLTTRLLPLKDNLRAKTGTLSDISTIAGFLIAKNGSKYVFCIMINNPASNSTEMKNLENYLIREMYYRL